MNFLKSDKFKNFALLFLIPLIAIIGSFNYNWLIGVVVLVVYIISMLYIGRVSIYILIANIKYTREGIEAALIWYRKAYESHAAKTKTIITYGYLLLKTAKVEEAERIFNQLLQSKITKDDEMMVKSNMALVLWKKGLLDDAIQMLQEVYFDFKTTNIYGSLGYLLILKGDLEKALDFNLEAYEYNNSNSVILDNLGQVYYLLGEYEKAQEVYEKLMSANPSFPEAYYNYSFVLLQKENPEKAFEVISKARNYQLSFLSAITQEELDSKITEIENIISESKLMDK